MMPFMCMLWDALEHKYKIVLLISLITIVSAPSIFNNFNFNNTTWWQTSLGEQSLIVPEYWMPLYPVMYFFLGRWLHEINLDKLKMKTLLVLLISACVCFGLINYLKNFDTIFPWNNDTAYGGYQNVIVSVIIFLICLKLKPRLKSNVRKIITWVAENSLGAYLVSYVADRVVYKAEEYVCHTFFSKVIFLPITILLVVLISTGISMIIGLIVQMCEKNIRKVVQMSSMNS